MIDGYYDQLGDVYTADATTGRYTTLAKSGLACNLGHIPLTMAASSYERSELAGTRNMRFDAAYDMPETAQVEVDGVRWQVREGTIESPRDWNGDVVFHRCDVVQQKV